MNKRKFNSKEASHFIDLRLNHRLSIEELGIIFNVSERGFFRTVNEAVREVEKREIKSLEQLVKDRDSWIEAKEIADDNLYGRLFEVPEYRIAKIYAEASHVKGSLPKGFLISPVNCENLLNYVFSVDFSGWNKASRDERLGFFEKSAVEYNGAKRNGLFAWFEEKHLKGLLLKGPFSERGKTSYVVKWYDARQSAKRNEASWFDTSYPKHIPLFSLEKSWVIDEDKAYMKTKDELERSMPKFMKVSRDAQIELIRDCVINHPGGSYQWVRDHGLLSILQGPICNNSLHQFFKWFDRKYASERNQLAWFAPALIYLAQRASRGCTPSLYVASGAE